MKKFILAAIAMVSVASVYAQIEQGTVLVGASSNAGYNSFKPKDGDSQSTFSIEVKGGYFVAENVVLGLNLGYASEEDASATAVGVFGRYYIDGKFFLGAGVNSMTTKYDDDDFDFETTVSTVPLEIGYAAFINNVIAVEPAFTYTIYGSDAEGSGIGINVGFTLYLNRGE